jgi:deoxyribodipyrimidine photo-lyase
MSSVPELRIRTLNNAQINADADFVLYWMTAFRRTEFNYSLQRAVEWSRDLKKPLVVLEALRVGYRWASRRLHFFVLQGMAENAQRLRQKAVTYYPYVEMEAGAGKGLIKRLAQQACVVVSDDYPCFFHPRMYDAAARQIPVRFEVVDSNGLLPMRAADKVFSRAFHFRRFLQKTLGPYLEELPEEDPLYRARLRKLESLPSEITQQWPEAALDELAKDPAQLADLPLDHAVDVASLPGGSTAAEKRLRDFVKNKLSHYADRNEPGRDVASGLSPYLHFGHISAHQVFAEAVASVDWKPGMVSEKASGSSRGWWGTDEQVESFLDELITWRELGFNMCWQADDYDQYESLPDWAQQTLADHESDERSHIYELDDFETAATHDELWNAAQRQLVREGRVHNYLRMLWGKKILEWTTTPREALDIMIELNNKYALDGRDPNSYSGIFWVLGRYDRAWGPERPVFGKIRFMSSENTARKFKVDGYLEQFAP